MNIYILENIEEGKHLTGHYHDGGGVAIVASSLDEAKKMLAGRKNEEYWVNDSPTLDDTDWEDVKVYKLSGKYSKEVIIFPDAGCC